MARSKRGALSAAGPPHNASSDPGPSGRGPNRGAEGRRASAPHVMRAAPPAVAQKRLIAKRRDSRAGGAFVSNCELLLAPGVAKRRHEGECR